MRRAAHAVREATRVEATIGYNWPGGGPVIGNRQSASCISVTGVSYPWGIDLCWGVNGILRVGGAVACSVVA
jgi:hypothetical protein